MARLTEIQKSKIKDLYITEKLSCRQIATQLHISHKTVSIILKLKGIQIRRQGWDLRNKKGQDSPSWKGGRSLHLGYTIIRLPNHPRAHQNGYVFEHILVWEQVHNHPLPNGWIVHHFNGIKTDNRPENLVAKTRGAHIDLVKAYRQRIRELEAKNKLLENALESAQMFFRLGEN